MLISQARFSSSIFVLLLILLGSRSIRAQGPTQIKGVFPQMAIVSDHKDRSEAGIGAVIPWANKLWAVGYVGPYQGVRAWSLRD